MKKEEAVFLNQLVNALEEAVEKLEISYEKKDVDRYNGIKRFIVQVQEKMSVMLDGK